MPASGKKHLFPGDDKEEKVDNNILDSFHAGEGAKGSSAISGVGLQEPSTPKKR
jgi:hypothetical protein